MLSILSISNKKICIDNIRIDKYIKYLPYQEFEGVKIYNIPSISFNSTNGSLFIYVVNNCIDKLIFVGINALEIYGISNMFVALDAFKQTLKEQYRQIDDNHYFNKRFDFTLSANSNNYVLEIKERKQNGLTEI